VTAEIMNVVLEDAHECFDPSLIIERPNATVDDLNKTLAEVVAWMASVQS
jgi:broad-specificity NMP kinase